MWLTGTISQVLLMYCSLPDNWLYDRVTVQFLGAAGTARKQGWLWQVRSLPGRVALNCNDHL